MRRVAVIGVGQTRYVTKRKDASGPELVYEAVASALRHAGLTRDDIQSVVFASAPESFEGVAAPDLWCADAAAARTKPYLRIHTGGATGASGFLAGVSHVASGMFDVVLVIAFQRVGESPEAQAILNTIWDPFYEKDLALNIIATAALHGSRHMQKYGTTEHQAAKVAVKNHRNALANPHAHLRKAVSIDDVLASRVLCWPVKLLDCCPRSDGACAVILASEEQARRLSPRPAWVRGVGSMTDTYWLGERVDDDGFDLADVRPVALAAQRAYRMAGITKPLAQIDVAEIYAPFSTMEIACYEALGFCARGEGGRFIEDGRSEMTGDLPVNPSGGVQCANPIGATALVRVAEAALQVMGDAGERQVPDVSTAVATGAGGMMQMMTCAVLGKEPA